MTTLIDYYIDLVERDNGDRYQSTHQLINPLQRAWENAKEESQFLFTMPIEGTRSYYFRRRKYNFKQATLEQRRCPGKNVWLFGRQ